MEGSSPHLFGRSTVGRFQHDVAQAAAAVADRVRTVRRPYSGASLTDLQGMVDAVDLDRPLGDTDAALDEVAKLYLDNAVWFHEPGYVAHLNCPVALPALSAEVLLAAVNSSVDTYDQSTTGTLIERRLVDWAAGRIGFGPDADGVFTSGGTQSNLHALLLAREASPATDLSRMRILATTETHFSVTQAAILLGLGREAVIAVATDAGGRMDPAALTRTLDDLAAYGLVAIAVVATAGTTDLGCVDPIAEIAESCARRGVWLHVDAAYGCGLLVSTRRRHLLDGIERADSVTVDFHKSFFQPISSSAIIVRHASAMRRMAHHADYLNPRTATVPNQVDKSLQTTRRFDALKLWMTLRTVGAEQLGAMFDRVVDLAEDAHRLLTEDPDFEVAAEPTLSTVLFRYRPAWLDDDACDELTPRLRARLFAGGEAIIAGTTRDGRHWLKFTLLNPMTTTEHLRAVLDLVRETGWALLAEDDTRLATAVV
ncbi:pyridoxal-dependent decarboxylase [Asanoa ishikariensis]|uniref:L-2,4-diaminobutyrate decarboxylase n=1 Tax=Asanoa ishikariensis TaxID=137265 RepID=A0A1H3RZ89_9ACTN|nr:pyridoxal-dependent decarboxylase [Asanoa ishikariensis]SDZ31004.1 L-2,4-diaminobutyrate decarboxylase [Asanoa ishikariensis]